MCQVWCVEPATSVPSEASGGYRRSAGSSRGQARRRELLERVADDLASHGLVDFSLRRAAKAAGTTHKVLLYYFDSAEDLLADSVRQLRDRRIADGLAAVDAIVTAQGRLSERVRALWPVLARDDARVLDQAIGLVMYHPRRYEQLGREASQQYTLPLAQILPEDWPEKRRAEVAAMILATLRGLLVARYTGAPASAIDAGLEALARSLDREEAGEVGTSGAAAGTV